MKCSVSITSAIVDAGAMRSFRSRGGVEELLLRLRETEGGEHILQVIECPTPARRRCR